MPRLEVRVAALERSPSIDFEKLTDTELDERGQALRCKLVAEGIFTGKESPAVELSKLRQLLAMPA